MAKDAVTRLRLSPVMFELGARPHPARELYRAYLEQSHIFVDIYWQKYGWTAPDMTISGLEDEYRLSGTRLKLMYVKMPAPDREVQLKALLDDIKNDSVSYKLFKTVAGLQQLIEDDLSLLLTEWGRIRKTGFEEIRLMREDSCLNADASYCECISAAMRPRPLRIPC